MKYGIVKFFFWFDVYLKNILIIFFEFQTEKLLIEEKNADDMLRAQFREKWTRTESDKLTGSIKSNLDSYKQMIQTATNADGVGVFCYC